MILVFDVKADMAMFRKPYTTTSALSFPFPPPTAVAGLICAIVGVNHKADVAAKSAAFWDAVKGTRVSISIKTPIAWATTAVNLLKFKSSNGAIGEHIQVKHQFVRKPQYRIFVEGGNIYADLRQRLRRGDFTYTPCLGLAYCIADVTFVGEFSPSGATVEPTSTAVAPNANLAVKLPPVTRSDKVVRVDTVAPVYGDLVPATLPGGGIHREVVPFKMDRDRTLVDTVSVLYAEFKENGKAQLVLDKTGDVEVTHVGDENVAWFKRW